MRPVAKAEGGSVRLLIAPLNSASQGYYWARAAELLPGVSACALAFDNGTPGMRTAPDVAVDERVGRSSYLWAKRQRKEILGGFTHVLYEAERPILSGYYGGDLTAEVRDLQSNGIKVGFISHGSDIRIPSKHTELELWSPFATSLDGLTEALEKNSVRNLDVLNSIGAPSFVSTPDLLQYAPNAKWLPTLTDPAPWRNLSRLKVGKGKPVVLHVPSQSALKGTAAIDAALHKLEVDGLVEYRTARDVAYLEMPSLIESADIVVDQVSMGLYGISSVEAMIAGRIVIAQVGDYIRDYIRGETGWEVPIIEANPETIGRVVTDIVENQDAWVSLANEGRAFAQNVHSPLRVADTLRGFLLGE